MVEVSQHIPMSFQDFPEPDAHAIVISFYGCSHNCPGCHNPQLHSSYMQAGVVSLPIRWLVDVIRGQCIRHKTTNVVLQGGDPLHPDNRNATLSILTLCEDLRFCIYTGYDYLDAVTMLQGSQFAYLKCGKYDSGQYQSPGKWDDRFVLASKNQAIFDGNGRLLTKDGILYFDKGADGV